MISIGFRGMSCLAVALCFLVALAPVSAHAKNDYDSVLLGYELSMAKVKAWEQATVTAAQALRKRLEQQGEDEAGDEDEESNDGGSIDDIAAQFDSIPEYRRAVHQAQLSTREFATIGLVLFQVMTMDALLQQNPGAPLPKNMNPANLAFVRAHRAELQQSLEAVQAASGDDG